MPQQGIMPYQLQVMIALNYFATGAVFDSVAAYARCAQIVCVEKCAQCGSLLAGKSCRSKFCEFGSSTTIMF